jgi:transposase
MAKTHANALVRLQIAVVKIEYHRGARLVGRSKMCRNCAARYDETTAACTAAQKE